MYVYMSVLRYMYASVVPTEVRGNDPPQSWSYRLL